MLSYASLAEAKAELGAQVKYAGDDRRLYAYTRMVSRRIDLLMTGRSTWYYFAPTLASRQLLIDGSRVNSRNNTFLLDSPLLAYSALTAGGTAVYANSEGFPQGATPYTLLRMTASGSAWYTYLCSTDGNPAYAVITGIWGYHSDYANAWLQVDTLAAQLTSGVDYMTVGNVDGDDDYRLAPRFSAGNLLKIEDEYLLVTDTDPATNKVYLKRPANGTTEATHAISTPIYRWETEEPIRRVAARQAAMLYARIGAFQSKSFDGVSEMTYPQDLLKELGATLQEYMYG